jgi:hypothetical protein
VPILLIHFAIFFSVSTCLAVCTRNTLVCVTGSLFFWVLCWGLNFGWISTQAVAAPEALTRPGNVLLEAGYWVLPKPADLNWLLFDALRADHYFGKLGAFQTLEARGLFRPELSVLTSLLFAAVLLSLSVWKFARTDY